MIDDDAGGGDHGRPASRSAKRSRRWLVGVAFFAAVGGFLFGYDTGVVAGALLALEADFDLSDALRSAVVAVTLIGALIGSGMAGTTVDALGRRKVIIAAAAVFAAGGLLLAAAWTIWVVIAGRLVVGLAVGFASMSVPVYVAEMTPPAIRGRMVTSFQVDRRCLGVCVVLCLFRTCFVGGWVCFFFVLSALTCTSPSPPSFCFSRPSCLLPLACWWRRWSTGR